MRVDFGGKRLASSTRPHLLFETTLPTRYYLPADDVDFDLLEPSALVTRCPYKAPPGSGPSPVAGRRAETLPGPTLTRSLRTPRSGT